MKKKKNAEIVDMGYMVEAIDSKGNILASINIGDEGVTPEEAEAQIRHDVGLMGYKIVDDYPKRRSIRRVS